MFKKYKKRQHMPVGVGWKVLDFWDARAGSIFGMVWDGLLVCT
jgi:hypothetical protein